MSSDNLYFEYPPVRAAVNFEFLTVNSAMAAPPVKVTWHSTYPFGNYSYYDLSRLCGINAIQCYVGTGAYHACIADVRRVCRDSFPDQAVPEGDSFKDSPAFHVSETFAELARNYKREAEIFFSEPPTLKTIFEEIAKVQPKL